ncbi:unnamed protein product [Dovyalis caffra]|uniref:Bet v I/Major latex protein domain-containing protein n=1 Tax=Dovyalis caffra TaxID=77055 RepID=A0AAV1R051_9ROSI|nr:unnamed protein product [Dovyalis caffra]
MALVEKIENDVAIKSSADNFFKVLSVEAHQIPNASPENVHAVEVHEGDWVTAGAVKLWTYTIDGKPEVMKEKIEVDEANKKVTMVAVGGHILEQYRSYKLTLKAVAKPDGADLRIVFDTDVNRSGVVDKEGNPINGDRLIALMSAIVLREHRGTTIVIDAHTSMGLTRFIIDKGGQHYLYRVGYRNVIDKGVQLNKDDIESHLMMETSGHGALKENYFIDDGRPCTQESKSS